MPFNPNPNNDHHDIQMPKQKCSKGNKGVIITKKCNEKNKKRMIKGHLLNSSLRRCLQFPEYKPPRGPVDSAFEYCSLWREHTTR